MPVIWSPRNKELFHNLEELFELNTSAALTVGRKRKTKQIYIYSSTDVGSWIKDKVSPTAS